MVGSLVACVNVLHRDQLFKTMIIYMKKLLDSDWLRAVQLSCNTSANYTSIFWIMIG